MNRKKEPPKKTLVRNASQPLPKTRVNTAKNVRCTKRTQSEVTVKSQVPGSGRDDVNFGAPQPQSILKIAEKVDKLLSTKTSKCKIAPDLAPDEKQTRKLNFRMDKPIYKDLIPIHPIKKQVTQVTPRNPMPTKELEPPAPITYITPLAQKEHVYIPPETRPSKAHPKLPPFDHLSLYRRLEIHKLSEY